MALEPYVHRCVVPKGSLRGNKVATPVDYMDLLQESVCGHCGAPLAPPGEILAHVYEKLTEGYIRCEG